MGCNMRNCDVAGGNCYICVKGTSSWSTMFKILVALGLNTTDCWQIIRLTTKIDLRTGYVVPDC